MVRASKSSSTSSTMSATPSTSATPVLAASTPVVETASVKKAPKKVATKSATPEVSTPATAAPVATQSTPAPVEQVAVAVDTESTMTSKLNVFGAKLQQLAGLFSSIKADFKILEKSVSRELKNAQKSSSRKKKSTGHRQPSGFVKPTRISDELAQFLGKTIGTEMARTEVSREINAYIRENGLQDKANGRKINADPKLFTLLKLSKEDELTYFNLQKFMKHHFIKPEVVVVATA
jgi:chromatin remodeling complex protein RSC6